MLATGTALRDTQTAVLTGRADGGQLQALTATRRQQIDRLVAAARAIAAAADRRNAPLDAVDATLIAATADAAAAEAVVSGRLVKELSYSGFGLSDDLSEVVAPALKVMRKPAGKPSSAAKPKSGTRVEPAQAATDPVRDVAAEKRAAAEAAATEEVALAQRAMHEASGRADDAQRALDALAREVERAEAQEQRLSDELAAVRTALGSAKEKHRAARGTAKSAHADAERARAALVKAQQKLDHLR